MNRNPMENQPQRRVRGLSNTTTTTTTTTVATCITITSTLFLFLVFGTLAVADAKDLDAGASCAIDEYYRPVYPLAEYSRDDLQKLLEDTHTQRLPYTNSNADSDDVWKALQDIDRGTDLSVTKNDSVADNDGTKIRIPTVKLIYSNKEVPSEPKGTGSTWNREHVWPRSHGVGKSGHDYTDLHHLFPADWGINSIRSNRYFDACIDSDSDSDHKQERVVCKIPAELEGTPDAPRFAGKIFEPPSVVRGDVARALFYMDLRYPHLELTDCPGVDSNSNSDSNSVIDSDSDATLESHQMAYLSTLLEWHALDPPTPSERTRNDRVCSRWQGNRNPFVDFPDLVESIYYGTPTFASSGYADRKQYCHAKATATGKAKTNTSDKSASESVIGVVIRVSCSLAIVFAVAVWQCS